jgi:hypothetical protein
MKKQMKAIDLHARKQGGETPLLCTPLIGRTRERVLAEATAKADMVHACSLKRPQKRTWCDITISDNLLRSPVR